MFNPKRLVFCGGGTRCLAFVQTLVVLEQKKRLQHVNEYWGTSAGALLASLMAMTKSATAVKDIMFTADYMKFRNIDLANLLSITQTWGMDDGKSLLEEIERLLDRVEPGGKQKTLADQPGLHIIVADLNKHETIVCNSATYPELRIAEAIRASMSLPIMFRPYRHTPSGHVWIDGGIRANFPWDCLPDDNARAEALGLTFEKSWWGNGPSTFMEYMFSMIHFDEPKKVESMRKQWPHNIIWFKSPPFPAWFVRFQESDYRLVESLGQEAADAWLMQQVSTSSTNQILPLCVPRHNHLPAFPPRRADGLLDSPRPSQNQEYPSLPEQQSSPSSRRWSV